MKTIIEHLDDLDRMVDSGVAPKHEVRYQIAFIGKLVSALEQDYAGTIEDHAKLQQAQSQRDDKRRKEIWNELEKQHEDYLEAIRSKQLKE